MDDNITIPSLFSVTEFSQKHRVFSESGLRWLIFRMEGGGGYYGDPDKNPAKGLAESGAVVRLGRRILIDEVKFFAWVATQQKMRRLHSPALTTQPQAA